ncbi:hypothetical protein [Bartonella phoceensis]|uniref:hypothetical protein n=1 Tax=Bartonella phoceensis TaxID=270249 RepID=UPI001ABBC811|nr:hypothetical protein [Bartonella phoceensis]
MTFLPKLTTILSIVSMIVVYNVICLCATVAIFAIYYSFFKRKELLADMCYELKMIAAHHFVREGEEIKEKKPKVNMAVYFPWFKEVIVLSEKDYKKIFKYSFIVFAIAFMPFIISSSMVGAEAIRGMELQQFTKNDNLSFVVFMMSMTLSGMILACIAFSLPVILVLYGILNYRVKKMLKKLKKLA